MSASQLILGIMRRNVPVYGARPAVPHISPRTQLNRSYGSLTTERRLATRHAFVPFSKAVSCSPFRTFIRCRTDTSANPPLQSSHAHSEVLEPRLSLTFTCTALIPAASSAMTNVHSDPPTTSCNHRSSNTFTKKAYKQGIVIIECPSCKNR